MGTNIETRIAGIAERIGAERLERLNEVLGSPAVRYGAVAVGSTVAAVRTLRNPAKMNRSLRRSLYISGGAAVLASTAVVAATNAGQSLPDDATSVSDEAMFRKLGEMFTDIGITTLGVLGARAIIGARTEISAPRAVASVVPTTAASMLRVALRDARSSRHRV